MEQPASLCSTDGTLCMDPNDPHGLPSVRLKFDQTKVDQLPRRPIPGGLRHPGRGRRQHDLPAGMLPPEPLVQDFHGELLRAALLVCRSAVTQDAGSLTHCALNFGLPFPVALEGTSSTSIQRPAPELHDFMAGPPPASPRPPATPPSWSATSPGPWGACPGTWHRAPGADQRQRRSRSHRTPRGRLRA